MDTGCTSRITTSSLFLEYIYRTECLHSVRYWICRINLVFIQRNNNSNNTYDNNNGNDKKIETFVWKERNQGTEDRGSRKTNTLMQSVVRILSFIYFLNRCPKNKPKTELRLEKNFSGVKWNKFINIFFSFIEARSKSEVQVMNQKFSKHMNKF